MSSRREHGQSPMVTSTTSWSALSLCALLCSCSSHDVKTDPQAFEGTDSGLSFHPGRGIFTQALDVTLTHPQEAEVRYTLDSSDPRTSGTAIVARLPAVIHVDPADENHRYRAPGVIVRASIAGSSGGPESVATHSYLFLNRVAELSPDGVAPGNGWPEPLPSSNAGSRQAMDYGMDPDVIDDPEYSSHLLEALRALPSLSLVTDLANLFDAESGIYANASGDGAEWERFASLEQLNPDASPGFQTNAALRIRGGYSRRTQNPKHAFRLLFKASYGTPKLEWALFGSEGTARFDKLDLRTAQNYSWSGDTPTYSGAMTMTRDVFSRDLQRDLGRPYTRSRVYHLYLDGVYWGLYQSEERPEAEYANSYWGGKASDYDTIKVERSSGTSDVLATDGDLEAWTSLWEMCRVGFVDNENYYRLEGKTPTGTRDPALPVLVDIDNLIDYMLIIF